MNKIVVGFDGREEARDALALGRDLAAVEGTELEVAVALSHVALANPPEPYEPALAKRFDELFAEVELELGGSGFVRKELRYVSPARGLDELAEREEVDLIVIGSTHRGALGRVYPGSVGERLLNGAPCPVVVAPRGYAGREHAGLGIIGVGYDGTPEAELALRAAEDVARRLGGSLRLIAAIRSGEPRPARIAHTDRGNAAVLRERFEEVVAAGVASLGEALDVESMIVEGDPAAVLADQGVELDLLVLGSRGYGPVRRTLLGGVSAEVMRTAPCPVLVVPRAAGEHDGSP